VTRAPAAAKINLSLVVGPARADGKHEVVTVYQRVALSDRIAVERSPEVRVAGFADDTLVRGALERMADGNGGSFAARIQKRIPVAAGLGGGSSDAATALRLANALRAEPYPADRLRAFARELGADVPYFLEEGPQLGSGDGAELESLELPQDYWILLVLPRHAVKSSTERVYADFDARGGERGYEERRASLLDALARVKRPRDPRVVSTCGEARGARRVPSRRHRRRADGLRTLLARSSGSRSAEANLPRRAYVAHGTCVVPLITWRTASR